MILYVAIIVLLFVSLLINAANQPDKAICKNNNMSSDFSSKRTLSLSSNLFFCGVLLLLWILTAFRSANIGNDTKTYLGFFNAIKKYGVRKENGLEYGYQIYCLIIGTIAASENAILIVTATLCYLGVGVYVLKFSDDIIFSLVLLFCICFSIFTNILRQSIAMVICLYAYQALKNKRLLLFALLVLFASTFHTSALIFLVLFFNEIFPKNARTACMIALILAALSMTNVISGALQTVLPSYKGYFDGKYSNSGWLAVTYEFVRTIVFCLIIFHAYPGKKKQDMPVLANFSMLLFMVGLGYSVNLFTRASEYFLLTSIVELPNALMKFSRKKRLFLVLSIGIVMMAYFIVVLIFRPEWNYMYPYEFWG